MMSDGEKQKVTVKDQTFIVEIRCRQNHTWQGTVCWVEHSETVPFRSVLELLKLIESAVKIKSPDQPIDWTKMAG